MSTLNIELLKITTMNYSEIKFVKINGGTALLYGKNRYHRHITYTDVVRSRMVYRIRRK